VSLDLGRGGLDWGKKVGGGAVWGEKGDGGAGR